VFADCDECNLGRHRTLVFEFGLFLSDSVMKAGRIGQLLISACHIVRLPYSGRYGFAHTDYSIPMGIGHCDSNGTGMSFEL
jgi:hypothetical protein